LVAKGFSEVEGIDVNKTFSLVAQMEWIQIVLIVVAISRCIKWMSKLIFKWKSYRWDIYATRGFFG
jgi:hypothetical protein